MGYLHLHIYIPSTVFISATQFTLGVSNFHMMNMDAIGDANMLYKVAINVSSTDWRSDTIPIPDGHSVRYIYAYLLGARLDNTYPRLGIKEIEAYAKSSFRK